MTRVIGEKRARKIWFMLRRLSAQEALEWGLMNKIVPAGQLRNEVRAWAAWTSAPPPASWRRSAGPLPQPRPTSALPAHPVGHPDPDSLLGTHEAAGVPDLRGASGTHQPADVVRRTEFAD